MFYGLLVNHIPDISEPRNKFREVFENKNYSIPPIKPPPTLEKVYEHKYFSSICVSTDPIK